MLALKDVSIGYHTPTGIKAVANGISAELNAGELTCLLGSNGIGKSTLLKTLSGFIPRLSGDILYPTLTGKGMKPASANTITSAERARLIAVVLTQRTHTDNMTAKDLVAMGRAPYTGFWGRLSEEDEKIVQEAMELTGTEEFAKRQITKLSDGERQKVMIAKALAQQTPVIFLDEPTAFLDYPSKVETMQLLLKLCHELNKTVFLSTHDVEIALQMADKLWLMSKEKDGTSLSIGTPKELAEKGSISRFIERENVKFSTEDLTIKITKQ